MDNNSSTDPTIQRDPTPTAHDGNNKIHKQSRAFFILLFIGLLLVVIFVVPHINIQSEESKSNPTQIEPEDNKSTTENNEDANDDLTSENLNFYDSIIGANEANGQIGDHVRGKADSKVVVIEYADFQCPGCATMMPYMTSIYEEYKDNVAFVFRNYPISNHINAKPAACAAEAAEALYAKRTDWIGLSGAELNQAFLNIFKSVAPSGDLQKFKSDYLSTRVNAKVTYDYSLGHDKARIPGTPSISVNGTLIDGDYETFDDLANGIRSEINKQLAK